MDLTYHMVVSQEGPDALVWLSNTYGRAGKRWDYLEPVMVDNPSFKFVSEEDKIFFDLIWL